MSLTKKLKANEFIIKELKDSSFYFLTILLFKILTILIIPYLAIKLSLAKDIAYLNKAYYDGKFSIQVYDWLNKYVIQKPINSK